ncbi:NAD(+) diphosphatase [Streptomyces somaliensis DSM 40738]|uniref:NAD(+) diphosphatase n=1 Tax=Streptomyces somaliensis (strain ATCC 33201 / DSM 40738 / JCM 12659 / KCTC 9044 / NCTC 11332 / NRRL B-12077 / IP 733) TaxID=1134445 RepID=A0AA44DF17_STRE0|nr:NAD(+) diphosphatase [Streptomyces somaliensis]MCQ0023788.1 NAD(+) diphosphatase [Streptomyces somaliensis DSM 40738]NKY15314.1 NAD(+) diphosphatase [Streptomyces somaliensis DSM 40738]
MSTVSNEAVPRPIALTAPGGIDRAAHHRLDEAWLAAAWSRPTTRVFAVSGGRVLVDDTPDGRTELVMTPSSEARGTGGPRYFLGTDEDGVSYFALQEDSLPGPTDQSARHAGLREAGLLLDARDAALMVHAVALENWQRLHPFCARCGERTDVAAAGHVRRCPACGAEHYPRTDPAVIMLVTDVHDRALLGRQVHWPKGRFSTLAGFVEPGETIEQSVAREVYEEAGVTVGEVRYVASQPWPFPSSLMLGFTARATSSEIDVDGDEIEEARWFSREELADAFVSGEVLPPYGISIAKHLIETWYGRPLPRPGAAG